MPVAGSGGDVTPDEPTYERIPTDELARLRRIEEAARELRTDRRAEDPRVNC